MPPGNSNILNGHHIHVLAYVNFEGVTCMALSKQLSIWEKLADHDNHLQSLAFLKT